MSEPIPLIIANLKANKTWDEVSAWLDKVIPVVETFDGTVVVCPSSPFLVSTLQKLQSLNSKFKLGCQDISKFEQGAYTGEVAASQLVGICQYVIVGHSERRQYFGEDTIAFQKAINAKKSNIEPIYCVQSEQDQIPDNIRIVAYEPTFAIGTGNPDTPQNAQSIAERLKTKGEYTVIYGGSVSADNVKSYLLKEVLDGVLIGATNSLDPQKFIEILNSAKYQ